MNSRIFPVCAPYSLVGTYYLHPPDARENFLMVDYVMHVLLVVVAVAQGCGLQVILEGYWRLLPS